MSRRHKTATATMAATPASKALDAVMLRTYNPGPFGGISGGAWGQMLNPDEVGLSEYVRMVNNDETASCAIEYKKLLVVSRIGEYVHEEEEIQSFIRAQFEGIKGDLGQIFDGLLNAIWAGFSVGEMIFQPTASAINLYNVQHLDPECVELELETSPDSPDRNSVKAVRLNNLIGEPLPADKCIIYTHNPRFGNPYGHSELRQLYGMWRLKRSFLEWWGIAIEKYGIPFMFARVEQGADNAPDQNGKVQSIYTTVCGVLDGVRAGKTAAFPPGVDPQLVEPSKDISAQFLQALDYFNKMIYRGLLLPPLLGGGESGGSYSLGQIHWEMFLKSVDRLRQQVCDVVIEQLVRRLIVWNFGERDNWGTFVHQEFSADQQSKLAAVFNAATQSGYLSPAHYEDMAHVRRELHLPTLPEDVHKAQQEERQAQAEADIKRLEEIAKAGSESLSQQPGKLAQFRADLAEQVAARLRG